MYTYIENGLYGPSIDNKKDVATIDELLALCKAGEVARVIIPMTGYLYGTGIMEESNRRSIQRDFAANRFKDFQGDLTVSAYQFKTHEWVRELIEKLQNEYPLYDESDYSQLETESTTEFVIEELGYAHIRDDSFPELDRKDIERVLFDNEYGEPIEFWEFVFIEGGDTPAMYDKDFETLKTQFLERWANMPMGDSSN